MQWNAMPSRKVFKVRVISCQIEELVSKKTEVKNYPLTQTVATKQDNDQGSIVYLPPGQLFTMYLYLIYVYVSLPVLNVQLCVLCFWFPVGQAIYCQSYLSLTYIVSLRLKP